MAQRPGQVAAVLTIRARRRLHPLLGSRQRGPDQLRPAAAPGELGRTRSSRIAQFRAAIALSARVDCARATEVVDVVASLAVG